MDKHYQEESFGFLESNIDKFPLLIVTATAIEKATLHNFLKPISGKDSIIKITKGKQTYYLGAFGKYYSIHVACGDMGSVGREASLVTTSEAISDCKPKIVLMAGIAFGKNKKKQIIGDILVSERVIPYEPQRVGEDKTVYRAKEGPASSLLLNRFRNVDNWKYVINGRQPNIQVGEVLSGEKLVDNDVFKSTLFEEYPEAIGGEMEGAGIYAACDGKVPWILVKGICDYADGKKRFQKKVKQQIAAESAFNLCEHVFTSEYAFEDIGLYSFEKELKEREGDRVLTEKLFELNKKQIFDEDK